MPIGLGETVRDALVGRFAFTDYDYTVSLEEQLDAVAKGKHTYHAVVSGSWTMLDQELDQLADVQFAPAHPCPTCSKALRRIKGSNGFFYNH